MKYTVDQLAKEEELLTSRPKKRRGVHALKIALLAFTLSFAFPKGIKTEGTRNIYQNNQLTISTEEADNLYSLVSEAVGEDITGQENALIISAAINNDNLTEEEKQIIYQFVNLLEENPYLDKKEAYQSFENLDILYTERDSTYSERVVGVYIQKEEEIRVFTEDTYETLIHELIHCIYTNPHTKNLPTFLTEGMTELLANEYFSETPFIEEKSYPFEITMVKILCDIVGPDTVLEAYSTGELSKLESVLTQKTGLSDPHRLIENIDRLFIEFEETERVDANSLKEILEVLDNYYQTIDPESSKYSEYPYNRQVLSLLETENPNAYYIYNLMTEGYYAKAYFSKELKKQYPSVSWLEYTETARMEREKVYQKELF